MSTFYFSGIEKASTAAALGMANAAGMMSRLEYSENLMKVCNEYNLVLVMDCGSFTRPMTREEIEKYAALIIKLADRFVWYASPDAIGNQEKSNENYHYLLSLLPTPLHDRILWIYQYGSDIHFLTDALKTHKRIGIGGLVPLLQADRVKATQIILDLSHKIRQAGVQAHFFGLSVASIISEINNILPDYTVDSTTWLAGARYGLLINKNGQQKSAKELGFDFSRESMLDQNIRTMKQWVQSPGAPQSKNYFIQTSLFDSEVAS